MRLVHLGEVLRVPHSRATELRRWWREILLRDPCVYCGKPSAHLDHIHPESRGGVGDWTNRAPVCDDCGRFKGDGSVLQFLLATQIVQRRLTKRAARYINPNTRRAAEKNMMVHIMEQLSGRRAPTRWICKILGLDKTGKPVVSSKTS